MIKKIRKFEIEGGFFSEKACFQVFPNEKDRVAIIYGKNGSGKSSIAQAFNNYKFNINDGSSSIELLNENNNVLTLDETAKKKIYVFNEDFIEKNVKLASDGLNTVVMFGVQGKLDEKIQEVKKELANRSSSLNTETQRLMEYNDSQNTSSPEYYINSIQEILKQDGNWSTREMVIKGNKNKSSVTSEILSSVISRKPTISLEKLNQTFDDHKNLIIKSSNNSDRIEIILEKIQFPKDFEKNIIDLLDKKIEKPKVTDREKRILNIIELGNQNLIERSKTYFAEGEHDFCPYCFQNIDENYIKQLLEEINRVLNEDVKIHKNELETLLEVKYKDIILQLNSVEFIDIELTNKIIKNLKILDNILDSYQKQIKIKMDNIYKPIKIELLNLDDKVSEINNQIELLEKSINTYNETIENKKKLINSAREINLDIAWYEIKPQLDLYNKKLMEKNNTINSIKNIEGEVSNLEVSLNRLIQEQKNAGIALDIINNDLKYIFFSDNRLSLKYEQDKYKIVSYGKPVKIKKVSAGERNIIALSYFFTLILNNVQKGEEYKQDVFLVIDDPISSFDFENKIGIYSFLKSKIDSIMLKNENSKIIIMTHELEAIYNLSKLCGEFRKEDFTTSYQILESKKIDRFPMRNKRNEYNVMLYKIYTYGCGIGTEDDHLIIGNTMRKVLETFSTFEFRVGIEEVTRNEIILKQLKSEKYSNYYKNLMYRLILNNESHTDEKTLSLPETDFYSYVSNEEKIRTCQDILTFIYLVNSTHIEMQFKDNQSAILTIKGWIQNIK